MSLKENMTVLKDELSSEEKFFEKMVNFEYFYKKYKKVLWALLIVVVGYFLTTYVFKLQDASRIESANSAYNTLIKDPTDVKALETLKEKSAALYDLYSYHKAVESSDLELFKSLQASKTYMISDMAKYNYAVLSGDDSALKAYIDAGIYFKDVAIVNYAAILMKQDKLKEAKALLNRIAENSPLYQQAQMLGHYGISNK